MSGGVRLHSTLSAGADYGAVPSTSGGTVVTASATVNAKGAWTQLGTTVANTHLLHVFIGFSGAGFAILLDIGIGPSGSQQVLIPNLFSRSLNNVWFTLPVDIPAGTALWGRIQSSTASRTINMKLDGFSGGVDSRPGFHAGDSIGAALSSSLGTGVITTATANLKANYAPLIASTINDYEALIVCASPLQSAVPFLIDIAVGASGAEQVIIPNIFCPGSGGFLFLFPVGVPRGSRIAARAQCNAAAADTVYVCLVGVYR